MSSSRPSSARLARFMASLLAGRAKDATDGPRQRFPLAGLDVELLSALRRQPIELGAPVVLRSALVEADRAALDQPVKRRIEGSLLDQQNVLRSALDRLGDRVAVRRPPAERAKDQQIQRALQQLDALAVSPRHPR